VKFDEESAVGICLELSSATKAVVVHALITDDELPFLANKPKFDYNIIKSNRINANASSATDVKWVPYTATIDSDTVNSGQILTSIYLVSTLKNGAGMYSTSLGHLRVSATEVVQFPFAKDWKVGGQDVSWSVSQTGTKSVSAKIVWLLDEEEHRTSMFSKYNIYIEKLGFGMSYLGFARAQAFYVSDLVVPSEASMMKFVIQPFADDGSCQELNECPTFLLDVI
jgi:mannosyl-glycoprotein endo-beta-N-acetylglucosaminidase